MKVINLAFDDYANFSYDNCQALRSVGVYAHSYKRVAHAFSYESQSQVVSAEAIPKLIKDADLVQLMHSDSTWLELCVSLGKRVVVYHTGTGYRMNPDVMNDTFNPHVERSFTDQCEFIGLGMKNETYIATAIDTDRFKPRPWLVNDKYTVAHYPSNPGVKGTLEIIKMMGNVKTPHNFICGTDRVTHIEQMRRMSQCDVYVELFKPEMNGKPYGCYGVTAFEAAAMGKIVVTNNIRPDVYKEAYGDSELFIANTERDFVGALDYILGHNTHYIKTKHLAAREWVVNKHSYKATGARLSKLLNL